MDKNRFNKFICFPQWHKIGIKLKWIRSSLIQYFSFLMSWWRYHVMHVAWQCDCVMREMMLFWRLSLFFYLTFLRHLRLKRTEFLNRRQERKINLTEIEWGDCPDEKQKIFHLDGKRKRCSCFGSHIFISHCVTLFSTRGGSCLYIYTRCVGAWSRHHVYLLTNTLIPGSPSRWLTPNSRISGPNHPCRSRGRDIFPRPRLGLLTPLPYIPRLRPSWVEICRDGARTMGRHHRERGEDGHWSLPVCLCRLPTWLGTASLAWAGARHHT